MWLLAYLKLHKQLAMIRAMFLLDNIAPDACLNVT